MCTRSLSAAHGIFLPASSTASMMKARIQLDIVYHPADSDTDAREPIEGPGDSNASAVTSTSSTADASAANEAPKANARLPVHEDTRRFRAAAAWIAQRLHLGGMTISVSLVDDVTIRELNREQLGHDWATDVISFVFDTELRAGEKFVDGEVIASYDTAQRLAEAAGWTTEDELLLYVIHGMLHIAGLDDISESDRSLMRMTEQECLTELGVSGAAEYLQRWERVSY